MSKLLPGLFQKIAHLFCLCVITLAFCRSIHAQEAVANGIAAVRSHAGQGDEFASPLLFKRVNRFAVVTNFEAGQMFPVVVENTRVAAVVTFDNLTNSNLLGDTERAQLQGKLAELSAMASKFPKTAATCKPIIEALKLDLEKMDGGQVRYRGAWMTRTAFEKYLKDQQDRDKARLDAIRMAAEKRQAEQERLAAEMRQIEENRQAMAAKQAAMEAAEEAQAKLAQKQDIEQRDRNLRSPPVSLGGKILLKEFNAFTRPFEDESTPPQSNTSPTFPLSEDWRLSSKPLPRLGKLEPSFIDGSSSTSPSFLYIHNADKILAARIAVALCMDGETLVNPGDLKSFRTVVSKLSPEVASWLPLGLASARTRLDLQKRKKLNKLESAIVSEINGQRCELILTEASIHDDGNFYAYLSLNLD